MSEPSNKKGFVQAWSSPDRTKALILRRLDKLTFKAVSVLGEALEDPDPRVRVTAAREVLDRRFGKPKQEAEVKLGNLDMGAAHLAALKALAEQGLRSMPVQPLLDVTPIVQTTDETTDEGQ